MKGAIALLVLFSIRTLLCIEGPQCNLCTTCFAIYFAIVSLK